ncbi:MAG: M15 family metallopeptidase [Ruminococcus sp.]|nr:M15 family metallopeptidase [Ruminococcus sp.]
MSYGLTPYDKKSYRDSKRRRRQALIADRTGKILPFGTVRRRIFIVICVVAVLAGLTVGGYFLYNAVFLQSTQNNSSQSEQTCDEELLTIVNKQNQLESDYVPKLSEFESNKINTLAYENLKKLTEDAESQWIELKITSAYVSYDEQDSLYNEKLSEFLSNPDYTEVRAQAATQKLVPPAGCSEAQTGLLISFDVSDNHASAYLRRKCVDYGFILRYPQDKEDKTKMAYNNSLYRYVGIDNAKKMRSYGMCLEEYVDYLEIQKNSY